LIIRYFFKYIVWFTFHLIFFSKFILLGEPYLVNWLYDSQWHTYQMKLEIKKYFWLILIVLVAMLASIEREMPIGYVLGLIAGVIVKDGILVTLILWFVMTVLLKKPKWEWYEWLNYLVVVSFVFRILFHIFFR